jgi:hypothetical protein
LREREEAPQGWAPAEESCHAETGRAQGRGCTRANRGRSAMDERSWGKRESASSREKRAAELPNAWEGEDPGALGQGEGRESASQGEETHGTRKKRSARRDKNSTWSEENQGGSGGRIGRRRYFLFLFLFLFSRKLQIFLTLVDESKRYSQESKK